MVMAISKTEQVAKLVRKSGVFRPRELGQGIARYYLRLAEDGGLVKRVGRGLYVAADSPATEHHSLAQAAKRVPRGIICLLSALRFHDLTTEAPHQVWIAIGEKARRPQDDYPPLRVVRFSGATLTYGVLAKKVDGVAIRVFNPAKTVADCFKYRNKLGLDVALEALREGWTQRKLIKPELKLIRALGRV